jgi:hypothetical protein
VRVAGALLELESEQRRDGVVNRVLDGVCIAGKGPRVRNVSGPCSASRPSAGAAFRCLADQKMAEYESRFGDCDGGWQTYMRQSMPGYANQAFAADGTPMKNWWPFLFY